MLLRGKVYRYLNNPVGQRHTACFVLPGLDVRDGTVNQMFVWRIRRVILLFLTVASRDLTIHLLHS